MEWVSWAQGVAGIAYRTGGLICTCVYKRLQFIIDPEARARDLEEVTASYELTAEGKKYLEWRNPRTVSKFFYTSHMVTDYFITQLQDLNKLARAESPAPNPLLHDPVTGEQKSLLSVASKGIPLVINFGSCT